MTHTDYENLPWPTRVRMARLSLPNPTKTALARELGATIHTVVNWESGKCIPRKKHHKERIRELCEAGVTVVGSKLNINFLLGGFDANETVITQPLLSRDKSTTTLALMAIATRLACHIQSVVDRTIMVISIDTVFNTYPSYVDVHVTPVEIQNLRFIFRLSHAPAGSTYTMELTIYEGRDISGRYVCDISDSNVAKAIRLLKKSVNKLKPNAKNRSRLRQQ